jgi:hypothetical protein
MGSTIIRTSPMQGNLSGDGPYKEKNFVAASPRTGGAKIELIKYKKTKKAAKKPSEADRKRNEIIGGRSRAKAAQLGTVKSAPELLDEIAVLDQRILKERLIYRLGYADFGAIGL